MVSYFTCFTSEVSPYAYFNPGCYSNVPEERGERERRDVTQLFPKFYRKT
jgi:hypothetical protein